MALDGDAEAVVGVVVLVPDGQAFVGRELPSLDVGPGCRVTRASRITTATSTAIC
jgi:hypothetical protein